MPSQNEIELCESVNTYNDILSFGNDLKAKLHSPSTPNGVSSPTSLLSNGYQRTHNGSGCNNSQQCWTKVRVVITHRTGQKWVIYFTLCYVRSRSPFFHSCSFSPTSSYRHIFLLLSPINRTKKNELAIFFADLDCVNSNEKKKQLVNMFYLWNSTSDNIFLLIFVFHIVDAVFVSESMCISVYVCVCAKRAMLETLILWSQLNINGLEFFFLRVLVAQNSLVIHHVFIFCSVLLPSIGKWGCTSQWNCSSAKEQNECK